jgi:nucleoside-diphosphate-sugar epimerase
VTPPRPRGPSRPAGRTTRGPRRTGLTVAVTGPTGTFGSGLQPLLEDDDRVGGVIGIARRAFDPGQRGWTTMTYRQGDVRDRAVLEKAFTGADVVVHLAFLITGAASRQTTRAINVDGTLNAFRAAAAAGARRFVYASSVAAYGFGADLPDPVDESWQGRPRARLFYAREKAELERLLEAEAAGAGTPDLYLLRPPVVLGPNATGGKDALPGPLGPLARAVLGRPRRLPFPLPLPAPALRFQFVHESDVGRALRQCIVGAGPPGAYNIAGDGVLTVADLVRELGGLPIPLPAAVAELPARAAARLPFLPPVAEWVEAGSRPVIMDTTRARELLGWTPRYSGLDALRESLSPSPE